MAETKVINLEVKTNSQSLKAQLREAQNEVNALADKFGATSQEAINAAKRAAELKDAIGDAKALTDSFNPDAKFNALSNSIGGVLNGFQAFEGALGLVGVEGEEVQKTLLKVQSAMALSQGLQGLGESIDSFKQLGAVIKSTTAFQGILTAAQTTYAAVVGTTTGALKVLRLALASTGIGALVVGLGVLISKISEWTSWTDKAKQKQDDLNNSLDQHQAKLRKDREELQKDLDFKLRLAQAEGKSDEELLKIKERNSKKTNAQIYEEIKVAREKLKALREVDLGVMASSRDEYNELVKTNLAKRKEVVKNIQDLRGEIKANQQNLLIDKTEFENKDVEITKKSNEVKVKEREKLEEILLSPRIKGDLADLDRQQAKKEKEISLEKEHQANVFKILADADDKVIAREKDLQEKKIQAVKNGFDTIGNLAQLFAGKSEKAQKRAFEIQKAANIANTLIDTYQSATSSYKSLAGIPYVGPALGFIAAGAAVAAGLANVKNIASQQFGDRTLKTSNTPSASTPSLTQQPPTFNVIGQTAQTQIAQSQQPIRAFVVSNEVTTQQALDRNRLRNATL